MIVHGSRKELENALGQALCRHIGYTTAAYELDRIYAVVTVFRKKPSAYGSEIIEFLKHEMQRAPRGSNEQISDDYLREVINFSVSMGLVEMVSDRYARVKRYAATQVGRSVLGIQQVDDGAFYQFYRTKIALLADADAIVPILELSGTKRPSQSVYQYYREFQHNLRERRISWLRKAFPERRLRDRIAQQLTWVKIGSGPEKDYEYRKISVNTARHHYVPRKEWLLNLGLLNESREITQFGNDVLSAICLSGQYFWIAPSKGLQEALHIPRHCQREGLFENDLDFSLEKDEPDQDDVEALVERTAEAMEQAYEAAKLVYAPQAPLQLPIEYIAFRSYIEKKNYDWPRVLELLFKRKRSNFERLSARKGLVGFYKVKARRND